MNKDMTFGQFLEKIKNEQVFLTPEEHETFNDFFWKEMLKKRDEALEKYKLDENSSILQNELGNGIYKNYFKALEILNKKRELEGHNEICIFCKKPCDVFSANPYQWPVALPVKNEISDGFVKGKIEYYHGGCIIEKLKELEVLKILMEYTFSIELNANDFYAYASGCSQKLDYGQIGLAMEMIEKFGRDGLNALMSKHTDCEPIEPYITEKFKQAMEYLKDWKRKEYDESGFEK